MCVLMKDLAGYVAATFRSPSGFWFRPCAVNVPTFFDGNQRALMCFDFVGAAFRRAEVFLAGNHPNKNIHQQKTKRPTTKSISDQCPLKTKNPRQHLAGRHFFSTTKLPFNQHPCPAILFLRLPLIFSQRLCVSAFRCFPSFSTLKNCIIMHFSPKSAPNMHYNALFLPLSAHPCLPNSRLVRTPPPILK